jgi:hypothetical protein
MYNKLLSLVKKEKAAVVILLSHVKSIFCGESGTERWRVNPYKKMSRLIIDRFLKNE